MNKWEWFGRLVLCAYIILGVCLYESIPTLWKLAALPAFAFMGYAISTAFITNACERYSRDNLRKEYRRG